jgi:peptidylprolyl isomerase
LPARHRSKAKRKSGFFNRRMAVLIAVIAIVIVVVAYQMAGREDAGTNGVPTRVLLVTSMGNITIELYDDMPITSGNFESLTQSRTYDGTVFHRVVHDFVVQGGDASVKGISVPTIPDELPNKHNNVRGSVAMAKTSEPNSATSQFYINLKDNSVSLDTNYSVFGRVIEGMAVVDAIGNVQTDTNDRPLQDVTLIRAELTK